MYTIYPPATFNSIETAKRAEAINGASERRTVDTICAIEFVDESADGRGELLTMNSWMEATRSQKLIVRMERGVQYAIEIVRFEMSWMTTRAQTIASTF
jgi:hypothetical protein